MNNLERVIGACLVLLLAGMGIHYHWAGKQLKRVGFQFDCWGLARATNSPYKEKWFWTEDAEFLKKVQAWRQNLRHYELDAALRQGGGRIVLEFKNGRTEEFETRSLGLTGPSGTVILNGQRMFSEKEPFSEFLRHIDPKDLR